MATIRAYTTVEQSRKLAEILPIESADMYYISGDECDICFGSGVYEEIADWLNNGTSRPADIPCWSLAALLELLKDRIIFGGNSPEGWFCCYTIKNPIKTLTIYKDSLVDACVAMIEKLNELNLL